MRNAWGSCALQPDELVTVQTSQPPV
jgi:hypothetical protein